MGIILRSQNETELKKTIRQTLFRYTSTVPSKQTVQAIYDIVIHFAADYRFKQIESLVAEWAQRQYDEEQGK